MRLRGKSAIFFALLAGCASSAPAPHPPDLSTPGTDDNGDLATFSPDLATYVDLAIKYDLATCPSCDDNIPCTVDVCLGATQGCNHLLDHSKCGDEELCTIAGCVAVTRTKVCGTCSSDGDCSTGEVCGTGPGVDGGTSNFCLPLCVGTAGCPKGFICDNSQTPARCQPQTLCCIDSDGDQRGFGDGCRGTDCDDHDPLSYQGNKEVCDGRDNDCNGTVDDGYLCGAPACAQVGTSGLYQGTAISTCNAGNCSDQMPASCDKYTCEPVASPVPGNACRTSCDGEDDSACITTAFCNGTDCVDRLPDGSACDRNRVCSSNHCQNGYCCLTGDCCSSSDNCPASYSEAASCDTPATNCQGHRENAACVDAQCVKQRVDDDSACAGFPLVCTPYPTVACTSAQSQGALVCSTTCSDDAHCADPTTMWCSSGSCVGKLPDGSACDSVHHGNAQCVDGHHCLNGFCCNASSGYCCDVASSCPSSLAQSPVCDNPNTSCQGHRVDRTCVTNICGTTPVADDSACGSSISVGCGAYQPVHCSGAQNQANGLSCPTSCSFDFQCTSGNHCYGGHCVPWVNNGGSCQAAGQCLSGYCWNGSVCCASACNNTTCDSCWGGSCNAYSDSHETSYCGDPNGSLGSGQFTVNVYATMQNASDNDDWYYLWASDGDNACFWPIYDYGHLVVTLDVPAGTDYDLYVYKGNCSNQIGSSINGTGAEDRVDYQEDCGGDDSDWYYIRVHRYYNFSCGASYHLNVSAHL